MLMQVPRLFRLARRAASTATGASEATLRASILSAALKHVPAHGWSTHALAAGATDVGLSPSAHAIVSGGGAELVAHFQQSADERLRTELAELGGDQTRYAALRHARPRTRRARFRSHAGPVCSRAAPPSHPCCGSGSTVAQRLSAAMKTRLSYVEPYVATWAQALALQALPSQLPASVSRAALLAELLDDYAHATEPAPTRPVGSGMGLVPPTACARRAAISGAYALAELRMVADGATASRGGGSEGLGAMSYAHVDELCAGLERGALSLNWLETELTHAAVHSRLVFGVLTSLGRRS